MAAPAYHKRQETFLRRKQVEERTGLSRSEIYKRMGKNKFPRSIKIGDSGVRWVESEIDEWIDEQIKASRAEA